MTLFRLLLIIFVTIPVIEIYLLIKVGAWIGAAPTIFLIIATAILGAGLLRWQGFSTMHRVQTMLARGELPAVEMIEGVVLLISGALLLTPGFFTDTIGFLCLIPGLRRALIIALIRNKLATGFHPADSDRQQHDGPRTLEGEFWHNDENKRP